MNIKRRFSKTLFSLLSIGTVLMIAACGRPSEQAINIANGMIPVSNKMGFTTQCPITGTLDRPTPVLMGLWQCPLDMDSVNLTKPPQPLIFQVDCRKKVLQVKSADMRTLVQAYFFQLDGDFDLVLEPKDFGNFNEIVFASDGPGSAGACSTHPQLSLWGKVRCQDRDKADIAVNARWNFGEEKLPEGASSRMRSCKIPKGCYIFADANLTQCP